MAGHLTNQRFSMLCLIPISCKPKYSIRAEKNLCLVVNAVGKVIKSKGGLRSSIKTFLYVCVYMPTDSNIFRPIFCPLFISLCVFFLISETLRWAFFLAFFIGGRQVVISCRGRYAVVLCNQLHYLRPREVLYQFIIHRFPFFEKLRVISRSFELPLRRFLLCHSWERKRLLIYKSFRRSRSPP